MQKKAQNLLAMKILHYLCAVVTEKTTDFLVTTFFIDSQCFNSKTERRKKMREGWFAHKIANTGHREEREERETEKKAERDGEGGRERRHNMPHNKQNRDSNKGLEE